MPEIVSNAGVLACSKHGFGLVTTVGRWTGRVMYECPECGVYVVAENESVAEESHAYHRDGCTCGNCL